MISCREGTHRCLVVSLRGGGWPVGTRDPEGPTLALVSCAINSLEHCEIMVVYSVEHCEIMVVRYFQRWTFLEYLDD